MTDEVEQPKKKGGWPKGKARGPRKPKNAERPTVQLPSPTQVPNPGVPASSYSEPVEVRATLVSGEGFKFRCAAFSRENGSYMFVSYPEMRGFKEVTLLRISDVAAISICGPAEMLETLRQQPPPSPPPLIQQAIPGVQPYIGPVVHGNPIATAIRQENISERIAHPALPMSKTVDGDTGRETIVGATMLGAPAIK